MKELLIALFLTFWIVFFLSFYIDMEITRREYLSRSDLRQEISGCRFDRNCRHYNKLLNRTEHNKENWELE